MTLNGFTLLNQKGEVTFTRQKQTSVLDLTWLNDKALMDDRFQNWQIREELDIGSDHLPVTWEVDLDGFRPPDQEEGIFNFKEEHEEAWIAALSTIMPTHVPLSYLDDTDISESNLNIVITGFMDALSEATSRTILRKKFSAKANPWWTDELKTTLQHVRELRLELKQECAHHGQHSEEMLSKYHKANNFFKCLVKAAKKKWAMDLRPRLSWTRSGSLLTGSRGSDGTPPPRSRNPVVRWPQPPRTSASCFETPFSHPLPDTFHSDFSIPHKTTRQFTDVTDHEIDTAIRDTSNTSAPGFIKVPYWAIKWAWASHRTVMTFIYRHALRLGLHHESWKMAITVVIPKPGKPSHSVPRAYRPIQLLECMGKVLEKIVASRLMFDIGKHELVLFIQFSGRTASSCVDAGLSLTHNI